LGLAAKIWNWLVAIEPQIFGFVFCHLLFYSLSYHFGFLAHSLHSEASGQVLVEPSRTGFGEHHSCHSTCRGQSPRSWLLARERVKRSRRRRGQMRRNLVANWR